MSKNLPRILKSLRHLHIIRLKSWRERIVASFPDLVDVSYLLVLWAEQDLCLVGEVNLDYLVREAKHYGMLSLHPFLHVNQRLVAFLPILLYPTTIQVVLEVLHKNNLLLEFFRVLRHVVRCHYVLSVNRLSLHVLKVGILRIRYDLSRIIEEDSARAIIK